MGEQYTRIAQESSRNFASIFHNVALASNESLSRQVDRIIVDMGSTLNDTTLEV